MFLTAHAVAGVVVAESVGSPLAGFFVGILSHFILDLIPHGDHGLNKWINKTVGKKRLRIMTVTLIDVAILVTLTITILIKLPISNIDVAFWAVVGALLPDFIWGLNMLISKKIKPLQWFSRLHHRIQWFTPDKLSLKPGIAIQLLTIIVLLWLQNNIA